MCGHFLELMASYHLSNRGVGIMYHSILEWFQEILLEFEMWQLLDLQETHSQLAECVQCKESYVWIAVTTNLRRVRTATNKVRNRLPDWNARPISPINSTIPIEYGSCCNTIFLQVFASWTIWDVQITLKTVFLPTKHHLVLAQNQQWQPNRMG